MTDVKCKTVKEKASADLYSLADGELVKVREYIDSLIEQYGVDAKVVLDWYYDEVNVYVEYNRLETVAEAQKRITRARKAGETRARRKLKKETEERELLAKLKEKYE